MIEIVFPGIIIETLIGRMPPGECRCSCWDDSFADDCTAQGSWCGARYDIRMPGG